jgi:energy-coupling factor transporter ATP-binding protein EcfA2
VALITQAHAANPGIVLLTGPSGAGKSSLLSAGLIPAVSTDALHCLDIGGCGWVTARMTPGGDPMAELRRCLDQPDVAGRAEGAPVLIVVDQGEEMFVRMSVRSRGRNSWTWCTQCVSRPRPRRALWW